MQILSNTNLTALFQSKAQSPISSQSAINSAPNSASTASASTTTSANSIGTYDFTNMTPDQMNSAVQTLYNSGKITSSQGIMMKLMGMPLGNLEDGKFVPLTAAQKESYGNTPVNYMQIVQSNMQALQQSGEANDPKSMYADDQAILNAMQQAQGSVSSVNITA
jgi:hypothetical protein